MSGGGQPHFAEVILSKREVRAARRGIKPGRVKLAKSTQRQLRWPSSWNDDEQRFPIFFRIGDEILRPGSLRGTGGVDQRDADVPVRIVGVVDRRRCHPRTRGFSGIPEPHFRGGFGTNVPLRDFADLAPAPRARVKPNSFLVGQEAAGCLQMVAAARFAQSYTVPTHLLGRTGKRLYYQ